MNVALFIYWLLVMVLFYAYFGYAIIAGVIIFFKKKSVVHPPESWPAVTCIIPCYNEEKVIVEKIRNTLNLTYPAGKLHILIVNDGSTDNTIASIQKFSGIGLINHLERKGKSAAINTAVQQADTDFIFFTDANALLNKEALMLTIKHFSNKNVGGVAGEKKIGKLSNRGTAEGWYWQYESFLKKLDAAFYSVVGATGEAFAMRTSLFTPLKENVILDDFFLSMHICKQGSVIAYEPGAYAIENPSLLLADEYNRKVRIAAGAFQSFQYTSVKKLRCFPKLLFQIFSRRWLRWIACPLAIPLLLLLNIFIVLQNGGSVYVFLLLLQIIFYILAALGALSQRRSSYTLFALPFYFLFMNYCMLAGFFLFLNKQQTVLWNKAPRS